MRTPRRTAPRRRCAAAPRPNARRGGIQRLRCRRARGAPPGPKPPGEIAQSASAAWSCALTRTWGALAYWRRGPVAVLPLRRGGQPRGGQVCGTAPDQRAARRRRAASRRRVRVPARRCPLRRCPAGQRRAAHPARRCPAAQVRSCTRRGNAQQLRCGHARDAAPQRRRPAASSEAASRRGWRPGFKARSGPCLSDCPERRHQGPAAVLHPGRGARKASRAGGDAGAGRHRARAISLASGTSHGPGTVRTSGAVYASTARALRSPAGARLPEQVVDQRPRTLSACGPFWPWVTSYSTFWPSVSSR